MRMEGKVRAVCISEKKGTRKREVSSAVLVTDSGIRGDAHAGSWPRQVSLLASEDAERMKQVLPELKPGDFAENILTQGVDLDCVEVGDIIRLGKDIILEVTQIGKECHTACEIRNKTGKCIMPSRGVFARVIQGGSLRKGDPVRIEKT